MNILRIALCQPDIHWKDPKLNRKMFENLFEKLKGNADVFFLPEMFTTGFVADPATVAENPDGKTFQWMQQCAAQYGVAIAGSYVVTENGKYLNRFLWMSLDGSHHHYDKKHLFSLGNENAEYSSGNEQIVFEYKGWKIRPLICYDLRFPIWARNSFANGEFLYDILLLTANWPASRSFHWRQLIMARAIENQCYTVGVNRRGKDGNGWLYAGGSTLATPDGTWIPENVEQETDVTLVELDKKKLTHYRKSFPFAVDWDKFKLLQDS